MYETKRRHIPYTKLKAFLYEKHVTQKQLSKILGISTVTLNQKINGTGGDFSLNEVRRICGYFNISSDDYFIDPQVSKMTTIKS